jgi:hypothetical protein
VLCPEPRGGNATATPEQAAYQLRRNVVRQRRARVALRERLRARAVHPLLARKQKVARLTPELDEALQRQTATADENARLFWDDAPGNQRRPPASPKTPR